METYFTLIAFSGKSAMAATVGIDSDFAYVKIVSSFISCFPAYSTLVEGTQLNFLSWL
jgi:hypothetical protein